MQPNKQTKPLRLTIAITICVVITSIGGCGTTQPEKQPTTVSTTTAPEPIQPLESIDLNSRQQAEYEIALNLLEQKKYEKAKKMLAEIAKNDASPADVKANFALANYYLESYDAAQTAINKAIAQQPNKADYYNLAGLIAMDSAHYNEAEQFLKKALTLNNEYPLAHYNLALLYDIYYQEIKLAYNHYLKYLNLVSYEDKETVQWVEQLRYSVEAN